MTDWNPISVVVVEDERILREEVCDFLSMRGMSVRPAANGAELEGLLTQEPADVVVLDLGLPTEDGIAIAQRLRSRGDVVGIVMMTARGRVEERILGYRTGADIYLVKPVDFGELEAAVRATLRNRPADTPAKTTEDEVSATWQVDLSTWRLVAPSGASMRVTRAQMQVLDCLTEEPGHPVSRDTIARRMGRDPGDGYYRSIDQVISRFRRKILAELGWEAPIGSAHNQGYYFIGRVERIEG